MPSNALITRAALAAYRFTHRSGLLDIPFVKQLFVRSYFAYKRLLEDSLQALLDGHPELVRGGWVFDVGANIGYTMVVFARFLDEGEKVVAFEPDADNFSILNDTIARHRLDKIAFAVRAAVGAQTGSVDLWVNQDHHADHRVATPALRKRLPEHAAITSVPLVTVDSFVAEQSIPQVALIKIDVQGYELEVCRGMQNTLSANPAAAVVFEYSPSSIRELGNDPDQLTSFFEERGFALYIIGSRGTLTPTSRAALTELHREYIDVLATRRSL